MINHTFFSLSSKHCSWLPLLHFFFPQIDPKVAFPRRAQPKVSRRISSRILALRDGCQGFGVSNRALATQHWNPVPTVPPGWQHVAARGQARRSEVTCVCKWATGRWVLSTQLVQGQAWSLVGGRSSVLQYLCKCSIYFLSSAEILSGEVGHFLVTLLWRVLFWDLLT